MYITTRAALAYVARRLAPIFVAGIVVALAIAIVLLTGCGDNAEIGVELDAGECPHVDVVADAAADGDGPADAHPIEIDAGIDAPTDERACGGVCVARPVRLVECETLCNLDAFRCPDGHGINDCIDECYAGIVDRVSYCPPL